MPLTLNKPYLGLRLAAHDGDLVFVPREGFCDGIVLDTPYIGLRAATHDGSLVYLISDQKLNAAGELIIGKPYIGLRAATHDGDLVYLIDGKECDAEDQTFCGCTICCTLEATVQFPTTLDDPAPGWGTAVDTTLSCDGSFTISNFHYCLLVEIPEDPAICVQHDSTWSGGAGSYVVGDLTYNWLTNVWVSPIESGGPSGIPGNHTFAGSITFTGNFRVYFAATEYTITEEGEDDLTCCAYEWGVLVEYDFDEEQSCSGTGWGFWDSQAFSFGVGVDSCPAVHWVQSECEEIANLCCPEGYYNNDPDTSYLGRVCERTADDGEGCIFDLVEGQLVITNTSSPNCLRINIADMCE